MPELVWTGSSTFHDTERGFISQDETIQVDESEVDEYLEHRSGGWKHADDVDDGAVEDATTSGSDDGETADETSGDETGTGSDDTDADADDESESAGDEPDYETHDREALEEMDYSELQNLARESDHPDIDGRSSGDDIINALADEE